MHTPWHLLVTVNFGPSLSAHQTSSPQRVLIQRLANTAQTTFSLGEGRLGFSVICSLTSQLPMLQGDRTEEGEGREETQQGE